ncbi:MAG: glycosyltransferase family 2 protein [Rhizobacter sp.]
MTHIDIVIPCAGRAHDLLRLLGSLHACCEDSLGRLVASVTLTDDRHSEALGQQVKAEFPTVDYVRGPSRGPAANRNNGAAKGHAEWILFLDDDCYVEADLLQAYAACIQSNPHACVHEGAIHPVGERPNGNHGAPLNIEGGNLWSCNLLIKRATFEAIGRFDERFPFACLEDVDLRKRIHAHGTDVVFARDAVVYHPWRSISERELTRQVISHAIYAHIHPDFTRGWTLLNVLRILSRRVPQYRSGRFSSIPLSKYRTVGFDMVLPMVVYLVLRLPFLSERLSAKYINH